MTRLVVDFDDARRPRVLRETRVRKKLLDDADIKPMWTRKDHRMLVKSLNNSLSDPVKPRPTQVNESLRRRFEAAWMEETPLELAGCLPG